MSGAITVVIPAYGPGPHLEEVVGALADQLGEDSRIVVSHSGDGNPADRFAGNPRVTVIHSPERLFAGAARNRGLALAGTDWVAFVDEDVVPAPDWYAALTRAIERDEADCIVGAIDYRVSGGYWGIALWYVEFGSVHPYLPRRPLTGGPSANMAVRREPFAKSGGFPEDWRSSEELVAQARMISTGGRVAFEPSIVGFHFNQSGAERVLGHLFLYGRFGARLRRAFPFLPGARAAMHPLLSLGLWLARLVQMTRRITVAPGATRLQFFLHLPAILICLLAWNLSFSLEAFRPRSI